MAQWYQSIPLIPFVLGLKLSPSFIPSPFPLLFHSVSPFFPSSTWLWPWPCFLTGISVSMDIKIALATCLLQLFLLINGVWASGKLRISYWLCPTHILLTFLYFTSIKLMELTAMYGKGVQGLQLESLIMLENNSVVTRPNSPIHRWELHTCLRFLMFYDRRGVGGDHNF